jgi:hypothetical protein
MIGNHGLNPVVKPWRKFFASVPVLVVAVVSRLLLRLQEVVEVVLVRAVLPD